MKVISTEYFEMLFWHFDHGFVLDYEMAFLDGAHTVTSFFAGCGGLDLGFLGGFDYRAQHFKKNMFEMKVAVEVDARCEETYRLNIGGNFIRADLSSYDISTLESTDVLIGGFPCQDFSICGPRKGLSSDRGQLYKSLVEYCELHRPKVFVAENVANIASMEKGNVLKIITDDFRRVGYKVNQWLLYAPDYGVPQARSRLFIVGVREDIPGFPICPEKKHTIPYRSIEWAIGDLLKIDDESVPNQSQYFKANKAKNGHGQGDEISRRDLPGYTVRANAKSRVQFHYELPRRLTVRECARLQTFPDNFVFPHAATYSVMQIGNAVPPVLAHHVAASVCDFLSDK